MMVHATGRLVAGDVLPYSRWTFLEVPAAAVAAWGDGTRFPVRVRMRGASFHGTLARSKKGAFRVSVTRSVLAKAGLERGDRVEADLRQEARPEAAIPAELRRALEADVDAAARFEVLAPSMRRAWIEYVSEAKRPATRAARAARSAAGICAKAWPR